MYYKIILSIALFFMLGGCFSREDLKRDLNQCEFEALGPVGDTYRRNYAEGEFIPSGKDGSYRNFMLSCMEIKKYRFVDPINHKKSTTCWKEDAYGFFPDALVDYDYCYIPDDKLNNFIDDVYYIFKGESLY